MICRLVGASLGFLAFAVTIVAGLYVQNPVTVTLSRSIFALFVFCLIGLLVGAAAQAVVGEYERNRESEITKRYSGESEIADESGSGADSESAGTPPIGVQEA